MNRFTPIWKSNGRKQNLDTKRITQIGGGIVALVLLIVMLSSAFGGKGARKDPFEIMERTPTTK